MELAVDKRYLAIPVSMHAQVKKLRFFDGASGALAYDLDVKLDPAGAQFTYYADLSRYAGQTLDLQCSPGVAFDARMTDSAPEEEDWLFRPEAHFSARRGWINDPNGLVLYEGKYHMFFQHNPVGPDWGNMHWGHAVSSDLMHWEEMEIALFPDEMGTMFSGSAIVDHDNRTGLKDGKHDPLLLFYTAAGDTSALSEGRKFTQCMAYSTDGGNTFRKYPGNPVVGHIVGGNRDPKVIFCEELGAYVMALYLDGRQYALLKSDNLTDWTLFQKIDIPGDDECPDFYPLWLDGEKYWILSGAHDCYLVGKMDSGKFHPVQPVRLLGRSERTAYAAQTFSGLADGRRVRISWNTFRLPGMPFNCSMTTPVDMYLIRDEEGIALSCRPADEINTLYGKVSEGRGKTVLPGRANDIAILADAGEDPVSVKVMSLDVVISKDEVRVGDYVMPVQPKNGRIHLRMTQDVHAIEIFPKDASGHLCIGHLADYSTQWVDAPDCVQIRAFELKNYRNN